MKVKDGKTADATSVFAVMDNVLQRCKFLRRLDAKRPKHNTEQDILQDHVTGVTRTLALRKR
jgi:hypothetical protein